VEISTPRIIEMGIYYHRADKTTNDKLLLKILPQEISYIYDMMVLMVIEK